MSITFLFPSWINNYLMHNDPTNINPTVSMSDIFVANCDIAHIAHIAHIAARARFVSACLHDQQSCEAYSPNAMFYNRVSGI